MAVCRSVQPAAFRAAVMRFVALWLATLAGASIAVAQQVGAPQDTLVSVPESSLTASGSPVPIPQRPSEPRAANAYMIFDRHCARCHQSGKTVRPMVSGGLANILAIDELARDPVLVKPKLPDASRLYDVLVTRHAPLDVFADLPPGSEPEPEDIALIREWIKDLDPAKQQCTARRRVMPADVDQMMREAQLLEREHGDDVRFISLVHLASACATSAEMAAYRQGLTKLLNSLSRSSDVVKLSSLDEEGTVLSFRLSDVGWTANDWTMIERAFPQTLVRNVPTEVARTAKTKVPIVNGDWFAAVASEAPLYYALLGMPSSLSEVAKLNSVDIHKNILSATARRIALRSSDITRGNRLIERHPGGRGGFWLIYDFTTSVGEQDIFDRPLGPRAATNVKTPFKPDQIRALFPLANGFYAFAIFDAAGNRIDRVLPGIEKSYAGVEANAAEPSTVAGAACFSCHTDGVKPARDAFKAFAMQDQSVGTLNVRAGALPLFANDSENLLLISGDVDRYHAALKAAGVDPSLRSRGFESISALARRYREDTDFEAALGEVGLERDVFVQQLAQARGAAAPLARRLLHGVLPRGELDRLFALLRGIDAPSTRLSAGGFLRDVKTEIGLSLWVDKPRPSAGDVVAINAEADSDCYLTLISVDAEGMATVLYPNDFEPNNLLKAGKPRIVPSPDAPYQLRFRGDGSETLMARCSKTSAPPPGVEHDFERQRFTLLGNWENFILDTLVVEAELRRNPEKAERARVGREQAQRRNEIRGQLIGRRPDLTQERALRDGRAVLVLGGSS